MKLLILSDIHGNWQALQSVINAESDADQILCLGDLVDYGPEPAACVAWAMQERSKSCFIQGNHDWGVASRKDPRSSPPFRRLTACTQAFSIQALTPGMLVRGGVVGHGFNQLSDTGWTILGHGLI